MQKGQAKRDRDIVLSMFRVTSKALKKIENDLKDVQERLERAQGIVGSWQ